MILVITIFGSVVLGIGPSNDFIVVNDPIYHSPYLEAQNYILIELEPIDYLFQITGNDFDLFNRIVIAESGWKPNIKNASSSASGLFQFLDSTFSSYCIDKYELTSSLVNKNDPYIQIDCAVEMIKSGGLEHWNASRHLWK